MHTILCGNKGERTRANTQIVHSTGYRNVSHYMLSVCIKKKIGAVIILYVLWKILFLIIFQHFNCKQHWFVYLGLEISPHLPIKVLLHTVCIIIVSIFFSPANERSKHDVVGEFSFSCFHYVYHGPITNYGFRMLYWGWSHYEKERLRQ